MTTLPDFNAISLEQLRAAGSFKWSAFPDCIGAFVAEMDFGTAPEVDAALQEAVGRSHYGYLSEHLLRELAETCAQWQATRYGWQVPADCVRAAPDVLGALEIVLRHYLPAGAPVVLPTPNYMPFLPLLRLLGNPIVQVPMLRTDGSWAFDYDGLDDAFARGARLAILCNPHNPIGRVFAADELRRFADIADRHGVRVFADEIHAPLVYAGHRHVPYASVSEAAAAHAITATSASKAWNLPGLKCAQLIFTAPEDLRRWRRIGQFAGHGTGTLGVIAGIAAYRHGGTWLDGVLRYLEGSRDLLVRLLRERLPQIDCIAPQGTYLAWLDCRRLRLPDTPHRYFREAAKVALTNGEECGEAGRDYVRLNFAMPRPILEEALRRMGAAIRP